MKTITLDATTGPGFVISRAITNSTGTCVISAARIALPKKEIPALLQEIRTAYPQIWEEFLKRPSTVNKTSKDSYDDLKIPKEHKAFIGWRRSDPGTVRVVFEWAITPSVFESPTERKRAMIHLLHALNLTIEEVLKLELLPQELVEMHRCPALDAMDRPAENLLSEPMFGPYWQFIAQDPNLPHTLRTALQARMDATDMEEDE